MIYCSYYSGFRIVLNWFVNTDSQFMDCDNEHCSMVRAFFQSIFFARMTPKKEFEKHITIQMSSFFFFSLSLSLFVDDDRCCQI